MTSERILQTQVADFLRLQYPDVLFHSDFGSSVGMTMRQGAAKKRQNGGLRGWPDMFIAKTRFMRPFELEKWGFHPIIGGLVSGGLFLELKKDGTRLMKQNGDFVSEHVAEQAKMLERLRDADYCAEFAIGFDAAVNIIRAYLDEPHAGKVEF